MQDEELIHRLDRIEALLKQALGECAKNAAAIEVFCQILPMLISGRKLEEEPACQMVEGAYKKAIDDALSRLESTRRQTD